MSAVSDDSSPDKPKPDWPAIRREYETTTIPQRELAKKHNVSPSTLMKRAMREKWKQGAKLVRATAAKLEAVATEIAEKRLQEELQPWIQQMQERTQRRGFALGEKGMSRIEKVLDTTNPVDAKEEANWARAAQTFVSIARTSLGMSDSSATAGPLNLQILTNQAAIQVNSGSSAA